MANALNRDQLFSFARSHRDEYEALLKRVGFVEVVGCRTSSPLDAVLATSLAGTPGLRWILPTIIGWGVRPAQVKVVAE